MSNSAENVKSEKQRENFKQILVYLCYSQNPNPNPNSATNSNQQSPANRLLHYTTFENNQYKFSLNNALARGSKGVVSGGGSISNLAGNMVSSGGGPGAGGGAFSRQRSFVEWPSNPASPYYYQGPSTQVAQVKRRDAKSDIGVPTRRLSGQSLTKTQLLTGGGGGNNQLANAGCYPLHYASSSVSGAGYNRPLGQRSGGNGGSSSGGFGLQPAKSDLFLSYIHGGEYERPYIYNYKMPQMPGGAGGGGGGAGAGAGGSPKQQTTAYHISGSQTADPPPPPPPLYGGTAPATDVMYYQFDKGAAVAGAPSTSTASASSSPAMPIVQQPRQSGGPLVYLQHGQNASVSVPVPLPVEVQQPTVSTKCKPVACRC